MSVEPGDDALRDVRGGGSDGVTVAFSDERADVCGVARIGVSELDGTVTANAMGVLFAGGEPVAVRAAGGAVASAGDWGDLEVAGVRVATIEPLRAWRATFVDDTGEHGFTLDLAATSVPAALGPEDPVARLGGTQGFEQLVAVTGEVRVGGRTRAFRGSGQRGRSWGEPDGDAMSVARTLGVWLQDGGGVSLMALRPAKATTHGDELVHAMLLESPRDATGDPDDTAASDGTPAIPIADPRLSTTYDGEGRQRAAGLELYVDADDDHARRAAGEVVCGTTLDLGTLRLDCAFLRWRMEGRVGVGRYDVLRRVG